MPFFLPTDFMQVFPNGQSFLFCERETEFVLCLNGRFHRSYNQNILSYILKEVLEWNERREILGETTNGFGFTNQRFEHLAGMVVGAS